MSDEIKVVMMLSIIKERVLHLLSVVGLLALCLQALDFDAMQAEQPIQQASVILAGQSAG